MSNEPLSGVLITAREIYDAVKELTGRVDILIQNSNEATKDIQDHENRIRNLERARWPIPMVSVILSMIAIGWMIISQLIVK